ELKTSKRRLIKNKRLQAVNIKYNKRPNDRFGFIVGCSQADEDVCLSLTAVGKPGYLSASVPGASAPTSQIVPTCDISPPLIPTY
ncbi:hypothetical protein, partial [uncultured Prevotella sp.]|uniref:hypothetical protein n=1 Tax=uncultured Prevotella sp. TaxID=159272 RepID=UPI0027DAEC45